MQAAMKQKSLLMLGQMYLSMIEYSKHDWHAAFSHKRLCYRRATAGTFILNLPLVLYTIQNLFLPFQLQSSANHVLGIQSSKGTSDLTSAIFFASRQLAFGRYNAPKLESFC